MRSAFLSAIILAISIHIPAIAQRYDLRGPELDSRVTLVVIAYSSTQPAPYEFRIGAGGVNVERGIVARRTNQIVEHTALDSDDQASTRLLTHFRYGSTYTSKTPEGGSADEHRDSGLQGLVMVQTRTPNGWDIEVLEECEAEAREGFANARQAGYTDHRLAFPAHTVQVGATWTIHDEQLESLFGMGSEIDLLGATFHGEATCTFESIEIVDGQQLAVIGFELDCEARRVLESRPNGETTVRYRYVGSGAIIRSLLTHTSELEFDGEREYVLAATEARIEVFSDQSTAPYYLRSSYRFRPAEHAGQSDGITDQETYDLSDASPQAGQAIRYDRQVRGSNGTLSVAMGDEVLREGVVRLINADTVTQRITAMRDGEVLEFTRVTTDIHTLFEQTFEGANVLHETDTHSLIDKMITFSRRGEEFVPAIENGTEQQLSQLKLVAVDSLLPPMYPQDPVRIGQRWAIEGEALAWLFRDDFGTMTESDGVCELVGVEVYRGQRCAKIAIDVDLVFQFSENQLGGPGNMVTRMSLEGHIYRSLEQRVDIGIRMQGSLITEVVLPTEQGEDIVSTANMDATVSGSVVLLQ